jgi:hypothetical protein
MTKGKGVYTQDITVHLQLAAPVCADCLSEFIGKAIVVAIETQASPISGVIATVDVSHPPDAVVAPHHSPMIHGVNDDGEPRQ